MTEDVIITLSNICEFEPINVFVPMAHVLEAINNQQPNAQSNLPRQDNSIIPREILVSSPVLIRVRARVVVVRDERKSPP